MVLDNPVLPLHNNLSESQIREHVKRRKISGGTKVRVADVETPLQACQSTFTGLIKNL